MVNLIDTGVGALKSTASRVSSGLHSASIQSALFGAITFVIVSHPATFNLVGKFLDVKDKNMLLFVHSVVFAVIMYFGTRLIFKPALDMILREGVEVKKSGGRQARGRTQAADRIMKGNRMPSPGSGS